VEVTAQSLSAQTSVFAFGTLKRGFPLHQDGLSGARYLGRYRTCQRYPMAVAGRWFAPMMFDEPGIGLQVNGELYEVDQPLLARLDALESIGKPGNLRKSILVEPLDGGSTLSAQVYMKARALAEPLHTDYLDDYRDPRFIPPHLR
jgi:gamma-glutamylaminecyclotransferase